MSYINLQPSSTLNAPGACILDAAPAEPILSCCQNISQSTDYMQYEASQQDCQRPYFDHVITATLKIMVIA